MVTQARVEIGTHEYVIDLSQTIRRPLATSRQAVDQGVETGEQSLDNSSLWKRTQSDFLLGQGQSYFDQEDESVRRRMRAVSGFDPIANRRALSTTKSMGSVVTAYSGGTAGASKLVKTRSNWWVVPTGSGQLKRSASWTSWTMTNVTGGGTWTDATVFGDQVYLANGTDVYRGSITGSSVASFSTENTTIIDATLGRLLGGQANSLFELDSAGARIDVFDHPNTDWDWVDFSAGTAGIYCAGHDGLKSELYLVTVIDATGALAPPFPVASFPSGELIRSIEFFGGFLIVATSKGVRVAQAAQSGLLNYGPLIELGDTYGIHFEGQFAYVSCSAIPTFGGNGVVVLGMDRFTAPLTPRYAASWPVSASGYSMYDVGVADGQVVALMGNGTNVQVFSTASNYGSGDYYSGQITYGTPEPKNWQAAEVIFDALPASSSVTLSLYDTQGGTQLATTTTSTTGATSLILIPGSEILREAVEVRLQASGTSGVTIRRWTVRAIPAPRYPAEEIILPLMVASQVETDDGSQLLMNPIDEWAYLSDLKTSKAKTVFRFGSATLNVWVDQLGVEPGQNSGWFKWGNQGGWPEGVLFVRLVTVGL